MTHFNNSTLLISVRTNDNSWMEEMSLTSTLKKEMFYSMPSQSGSFQMTW